MYMTTSEIRKAFLDYYHSKGHEVVRSSSLVPHNDPTLLFTNAGMNQFKDIFLGKEVRNYTRATTAQRCVRAGGKHNDLDNVGYTARHHTFFEMLGNFSFGDYFKHDAIHFAWGFLTGILQLPKEKLTVTVYQTDDEAYDIWHNEIGLPSDRIIRIGDNKGAPYASDNFWQMGDTGPCGPCTEIFYDHGADIWGGPPGSPEEDGDRFIEIWNIVFMQFNRKSDGTFEKLPKPSVDTGMGLERISAVMQNVHSNYDIDLFKDLIAGVAKLLNVTDLTNKSLRVIADHIRSCSFLISDGVLPSNEGRGYVLRRIIRRAVRHGRLLGSRDVFFYKLVKELAKLMGDAYPELISNQSIIEDALKREEEQFIRTLDRGLSLLNDELSKLGESKEIPGSVVFKLYDTYGFPVDLTADVVRDAGYSLDLAGFDAEMAKQKKRAKESSSFDVDYNAQIKVNSNTEFLGYNQLCVNTKILALYSDNEEVETLSTDEQGVIVLDKTPFYAELGGQMGDKGVIIVNDNCVFRVLDTKKIGNTVIHIGKVELGLFIKNQEVMAKVDEDIHKLVCAHHSSTHLLQAALRHVVGTHVVQKGSSVTNEHLRFDYSHNEPLTNEQIFKIESLVNDIICKNIAVDTKIMNLEEAKKTGAMALFGEKYDNDVRVVSMGDFSCELCGGTHVKHTGDIGCFKIVSDSSIASGVRRIEAKVSSSALAYIQKLTQVLDDSASMLKIDALGLSDKLTQSLEYTKKVEKEVELLKEKLALASVKRLMESLTVINGMNVLIDTVYDIQVKELRIMLDDLKNRIKSGIILIASVVDGKVSLISGVTKDLTNKIKAGELVGHVASQIGGKGGGRPDMAQGGGTDVSALPIVMKNVTAWIQEKTNN
ncbi:MAG: alanine--tRNA ligase [Succinivibrionaceae bacterium]